jgi:hypothetical protein
MGSFRRYTYPMTVAVGIPAATAVLWAWRAPPRQGRRGELDPLGAALWLGVLVSAALWELAALLFQPSLVVNSPAHPTLSVLLDPVLSLHVGRFVGLAI